MMNDIDQVYELSDVREKHLVSKPFDNLDNDCHGWVKGTIEDFEMDEEDEELDAIIRLPWGETHTYGWPRDELYDGPFENVCEAYGKSVGEFEALRGAHIWVKVRYIRFDDAGDIETGTRMRHEAAKLGPTYSQRQLAKRVLLVLTLALVALVGFGVVP